MTMEEITKLYINHYREEQNVKEKGEDIKGQIKKYVTQKSGEIIKLVSVINDRMTNLMFKNKVIDNSIDTAGLYKNNQKINSVISLINEYITSTVDINNVQVLIALVKSLENYSSRMQILLGTYEEISNIIKEINQYISEMTDFVEQNNDDVPKHLSKNYT